MVTRHEEKVGLYLMTAKGLAVLQVLLEKFGPGVISFVVTAEDKATARDWCDEIRCLANESGIPVYDRQDALPDNPADWVMSVGWRWLIPSSDRQFLVVIHDSLLPRYRGFAPLVSALVNGDEEIGVTALAASEKYDRGEIIAQKSVKINYPIKISEAIDQILPCYQTLAVDVLTSLYKKTIKASAQNEQLATYSLWRDDEDYLVDWSLDAQRIQRFVDAVDYPYKGAAVSIGEQIYRIRECCALPDVKIENRTPGKVIFSEGGKPVVVCGRGLLKILDLRKEESGEKALPLPNFRVRFRGVSLRQ